jgi:hypothetical protein
VPGALPLVIIRASRCSLALFAAAALAAAAVEVILAAPKKVPKEEKLYVERPGFGKVR